MIYCEGKQCSRREDCAYHEIFKYKYLRQVRDISIEGSHCEDCNGNIYSHYYCGDKADHYCHYKAIGYRENEEYKNSENTICDEICLCCEYKHICYLMLEFSGMIISAGDRIRFDCEKIKSNPKHYLEKLKENGFIQ